MSAYYELGLYITAFNLYSDPPEGRGSIPKKEVEAEGPSNLFVVSKGIGSFPA